MAPLLRAYDVGFGEITSLEEKWLTAGLRKRIRETVAEIEARGMSALAVIGECLPCNMGVFLGHRLDRNGSTPNQRVELTATLALGQRLDHDRRLDKCGSRHSARICPAHRAGVNVGIALAEENSDDCRCVEDHL